MKTSDKLKAAFPEIGSRETTMDKLKKAHPLVFDQSKHAQEEYKKQLKTNMPFLSDETLDAIISDLLKSVNTVPNKVQQASENAPSRTKLKTAFPELDIEESLYEYLNALDDSI